jgi:hypothetical protein
MKEILLSQDQVTLVDDEDFERVNQFQWCARWSVSGRCYYACRTEDRKFITLSRFILDYSENKEVDHKNHNTLDNQKHNLRVCTRSENMQNSRSCVNSTSRYKGVFWDKARNKWCAQICIRDIFDQKYRKHLGRFEIEEEAALTYDKAARYHFGEFAYLNFPINK